MTSNALVYLVKPQTKGEQSEVRESISNQGHLILSSGFKERFNLAIIKSQLLHNIIFGGATLT